MLFVYLNLSIGSWCVDALRVNVPRLEHFPNFAFYINSLLPEPDEIGRVYESSEVDEGN
jgi:hypothetical protein